MPKHGPADDSIVFEVTVTTERDASPQVLLYALTLHNVMRQDTNMRDKYQVLQEWRRRASIT